MPALPTPPLLDRLLRVGAPSGHERPAAEVWRDAASSFATVEADGIGSSIARVGTAAPLLAVIGHIDEIGLLITHVDEQGFLWFAPIGSWDPQVLVAQRVDVRGRHGLVPGVVGHKPPFLQAPGQRDRPADLTSLHIDVGAANRDEAIERVAIGDPVVIAAEPRRLAGDRIASRALDDRVGAYVALESLRRCAASDGPGGSFAAVATVQEEIGVFGARTATFALRPDVAVAVDVFYATDVPDVDARHIGAHPLGSGPIIGRGATLSPAVSDLLVATAEAEGIDHTIGAYGSDARSWSTFTDADMVQISRSGVATGLVSIPLRYMHSPVETVDLRDVEAAVRLLAAFGARLDSTVDLAR